MGLHGLPDAMAYSRISFRSYWPHVRESKIKGVAGINFKRTMDLDVCLPKKLLSLSYRTY